jgi:hypothetical protein
MTIVCPNCAAEIAEHSQSCAHCGKAIAAPAPVSEAIAPALQPMPPLEAAPPATPMFSIPDDLEGLGGWLILIGIGLAVSPFLMLYTALAVNLPVLIGAKYQGFLSTHPALAGLLGFEIITSVIFIAAVLALNFLFYTRKRAFPTYFILYMIAQLCVAIGDVAATHLALPSANLTHAYTVIARAVIASLIWIPYFLVSRRVKATFVR